MNIWNWVEKLQDGLAEAGQAHSAELIDRVTTEICDLEVERAEALLPEAKALCKTLENPWLEVFVGHWEMRNRLGNKTEGESALADAIALFELAHRKETQDCPQSICVTQDLASCYGNMDGPGWAKERIEVCEETLTRINPSWPCFRCLSEEKVDALLDQGQAEIALNYLETQEASLTAAGEESDSLKESRNKILMAQGRYEEVLDNIAQEEARIEGYEWPNIKQPRTLLKVRALAALKRDEEAWEILPPLHTLNPGVMHAWLTSALPLLQRHPEENTWGLGSRLQQGLEHYSAHGAHRILINMAIQCVELALQRGAHWSAQRYLKLAEQHLGKLRADHGAGARLEALSRQIASQPARTELPVPPEALMEWLNSRNDDETPRNPEQEVEWLLQALKLRPEDTALLEQTSSALQACGADAEAIQLLWDYLKPRSTSEENLAYTLLGIFMRRGDYAGIEQLARLYEDSVPVTAQWCRAQAAQKQGNWPAAEASCRALLATSPASLGARSLLAHSLMQQQRFAEAAQCYQEMHAQDQENNAPLWDYMSAATAAGDWQGVRQAALHLGMELSGTEGPVVEDWGWIIIRYIEDGEALDYYARRTGPVSATILENAMGKHRQHVNEQVVFNAEPLFPAPEDEEERQHFIPTFRWIHRLEPGGFSKGWLADGAAPEETAFETFRDNIHARGWRLWVHSRNDYTVTDSTTDQTLPGLYFTIAAPESVPATEIHKALKTGTKDWPHPLCWLNLAEHCGEDTEAHRAVIERYQLW